MRGNEIDRAVGARLRKRREALGVDAAELAAELGVALDRLREFEDGELRMSAEIVRRAARRLGFSPLALFADEAVVIPLERAD